MARIVATPGAGDWFKGGVVAYNRDVKSDLLGVEPGPVVTSAAAQQMAKSVPVGTLFVGVADRNSVRVHHIVLSGEPDEIRASAAELALLHLRRRAGLDVRLRAG